MCSLHYLAIVWSAMFLGISYFLYTPIPHGFAEPWRLRSLLAGYKTMGLIASISEKLGYDSSINVTRKLLEMSLSPGSINDPELQVTNTMFDGVPVRIYKPIRIKTPAPALIYFHGGGWVMLSVDSYDLLTRHIAKEADVVVISVEYRLAPEHPFPIPFDDCVTATTHLLQNSEKYGVDSSRVAVGGDSAGGNLAAAVAQRLSFEPETFIPKIKLQLLVYPALQMSDFNTPSYLQNNGMGGLLTKDAMISYWLRYMDLENIRDNSFYFKNNQHTTPLLKHSQYIDYVSITLLPKQIQSRARKIEYRDEDVNMKLAMQIEDRLTNPYFAPLMAVNLSQVAPAYILNTEYDVLRDDGLMYGERLRRAGVNVHMHNVRYAYHGCCTPLASVSAMQFEMGITVWEEINKHLKMKLHT